MTKRSFSNKKLKREIINNIPLGRVAEVSDVATTVAFLASNASSMITGTSILVDGGWTAK
jgi:NAD(P)-dependent dehydrogenase (short-subunit alcohol dehydrogenase family)